MEYIDIMFGEDYFKGQTFYGIEFEVNEVVGEVITPVDLTGAVVRSQLRKDETGVIVKTLSTTENTLKLEGNKIIIPECTFNELGVLISDFEIVFANEEKLPGFSPYKIIVLNPVTR